MGLLVDAADMIVRDLRIDLRGGEVGMSQELLDAAQGRAAS
jgi:hypothetical protein